MRFYRNTWAVSNEQAACFCPSSSLTVTKAEKIRSWTVPEVSNTVPVPLVLAHLNTHLKSWEALRQEMLSFRGSEALLAFPHNTGAS